MITPPIHTTQTALAGSPLPTAGLPPVDAPCFDVVVVPDFLGDKAHVQESQVLLLLASWLEVMGANSGLPLHLACIGEPPVTVRRLAEQCGGRISIHRPLAIHPAHHVGNKLRGLEVEAETDQLLLLDADTLLLSDIRWLGHWKNCLAAAPDDCPRVTDAQWRRIYSDLAIPFPSERTPCLSVELNLPRSPGRLLGFKVPREERAMGVPYFNSGALWVPRDCGLRPIWEQNIRRIADLFPKTPRELNGIHRSDQAGLAVSLQMLRQQGHTFRRLPDVLNVRWRHLYAGTPRQDRIGVLHLTTFLHQLPPGPVREDTLRHACSNYLRTKLRRRFHRILLGEALRGNLAACRRYRQAVTTCRQLESHLHELLGRHVQPVLESPAIARLPEVDHHSTLNAHAA
jgi:hypothetical protein